MIFQFDHNINLFISIYFDSFQKYKFYPEKAGKLIENF